MTFKLSLCLTRPEHFLKDTYEMQARKKYRELKRSCPAVAVRTASEGHHAGPTHVQRPGDLLLLAASEQEEEEEEVETRGAAAAVEAVREERARRREAKKANRPICEVAPWASLNLVGLNL